MVKVFTIDISPYFEGKHECSVNEDECTWVCMAISIKFFQKFEYYKNVC